MTNTEEWLREVTGDATASQPNLTPDEWVAIRDEIREYTFGDKGLIPDGFTELLKLAGEIGTSSTTDPARSAAQCLRDLLYRAKNGAWRRDIEAEPAWSLDSSARASLIRMDDQPTERPWETTLGPDELEA